MLQQSNKRGLFPAGRSSAFRIFVVLLVLAFWGGHINAGFAGETAGMTLAGSSGLLTVPVVDIASAGRGLALKINNATGKADLNGTRINLSKNEQVLSVRNKFTDEIEVTLVHLRYDRTSIAALTGSAQHYGIGVKVSPLEGCQDFCYGFNFAPMTTYESMLADIEQIESLRNIYATFHEKLTKRLNGYLNLAVAFTGSQRIEFSDGSRRDVARNDIYIGTLAGTYRLKQRVELIGEFKVGQYRGMMFGDTVRYRLHAGARFTGQRYGFELAGYNLNDADPTIGIGGNMNF